MRRRASVPGVTSRITIRPVWTLHDRYGVPMPPRLPELLVRVHARGSLLAACRDLDMSYRHAWELVRRGEEYFGGPLLVMKRGKGSTLTDLGERLVWADHRITTRLAPVLDSLASELAGEISRATSGQKVGLRLHASHGFAVEKLLAMLAEDGTLVEHRWTSSVEASSALHDRACDVAGFQIPQGALQARALEHYAPWTVGEDLQVIEVATRRQGLMVPPGNPKKVYDLFDIARLDVRFINRQAGSGTRFLLEGLLEVEGIAAASIPGFEQGEQTHQAVAAYVASGMADAGFGLETAARRFGLDFVPLATERYLLMCRTETLGHPQMEAILAVLRSTTFRTEVDALQGYDARQAGLVRPLADAFAAPVGT